MLTGSGPVLPQWTTPSPATTWSMSWLPKVFSHWKRLAAAVVCLVLVGAVFSRTQGDVVATIVQSVPDTLRPDTLTNVYNRTLGFQKVFAIGFEARTDKRDARTLASSLTGFDIDWLPAVAFEDIDAKAAPPTWSFDKQSKGALGCWRAHMNALQKIVSERIQTAMIVEDDADWDVHLKDQLLELATGARAIQEQSPLRSSPSPYGSEWDLLWIGHCRIGPTDDEQQFWVVEDDATVPPRHHRHAGWRNSHYPAEMRSNTTRLILRANGGACTYSYAVTYNGARKMLSSLSLESRDLPVDISLSALCREKFARPFRCYAPYPPYISTHHAAGPASRDSDLNDKGSRWHDASSTDLVYSTIMNIPSLVQGDRLVKAQWPDVLVPEVYFGDGDRSPARGSLRTIQVYNTTTNMTDPIERPS